jgi:hypothetical protein
MQHLRSVGDVPDGILLEAPKKDKGKGKANEVIFGEKVLSLIPLPRFLLYFEAVLCTCMVCLVSPM